MNTKLQQEFDYAQQVLAKVEAAKRQFFEIQKQLEQLQRQTENYIVQPINTGPHMVDTMDTKIIDTLEHMKIDPMITDKTKVDKARIDTINNSKINNTALSGTHMI